MSAKTDDLEAVRLLAETLQPFTSEDRERIIRWAREKLGMTAPAASGIPQRTDGRIFRCSRQQPRFPRRRADKAVAVG